MEHFSIQVGPFEVNCSVLHTAKKAFIVDPGSEPERILALLKEKDLVPEGVLLTHAHFDHIGAIPALQRAFPDLPVYLHEQDWPVFANPLNQFPPDYPPIALPANLRPAKENPIAQVIETPGHTPGGCCYLVDDLLLSGDTLFAGSIGRTDLPGGDMALLMRSLGKLVALPEETLVMPGHGPATTLGVEKRQNPFLAPARSFADALDKDQGV